MDQKTLEQEIQESSSRIEKREENINKELESLANRIVDFTRWAWIFVILGFAIAIFSTILFLCQDAGNGFTLNLLGDFMAGTVASVWSLAGLFFIYVAFLGQKQQLLNQQLEIMYSQLEVKYTRLELSGQREEMIEQNQTLKQQKFENTFFQLLSLFNSIVNSLDLRDRAKMVTTSGRDCFTIFYKRLNENLSSILVQSGSSLMIDSSSVAQAIDAYDILYSKDKSDMSHYFRTIYHIFKFIDNSEIDNKKQYVAIARAQLSSYEQILLFYNCLHKNGREKFKPLIEKYGVFKNIDHSLLLNPKHSIEYNYSAYGE